MPARPDKYLLLLLLCQLATTVGALGIFVKVGVSVWFLGTGAISFLLICAVVDIIAQRGLAQPQLTQAILIFARIGTALILLVLLGLAWALLLRTAWADYRSLFGSTLVCVFLIIFAYVLLLDGSIARTSIPWFQFSIGGIGGPLLLAWLLGSAMVGTISHPAAAPSTTLQKEELSRRLTWAKHDGWKKSDGRPIVIAVNLSGGGYRAATVHAGFLHALEEKCVPIRYLTTVSGGSIIGAYYALGNSPNEFRKSLERQRPGLPDDFLSMWWVFAEWWWPGWNSSDTYSRHFTKAFFGSKALGDTDLAPQLIIGATDFEAGEDGREVFFKGRSKQYPRLDKTRLAGVVAASGAFPGAFQPKVIFWPPSESDSPPEQRRFIDGGVVDNLGYASFARFFATVAKSNGVELKVIEHEGKYYVTSNKEMWSAELPRPDILIISDASANIKSTRFPNKVGLLDLLSRAQDISYSIQLSLLRGLAGKSGEWPEIPETLILRAGDVSIQEALQERSFTPDWDGQAMRGDTVAKEVGDFPTLGELEGPQIEKAFWLGRALGEFAWRRIDRVRSNFTSSPSCPLAQ